jgi:uncharacterized protein YceH (UPF0502 family)
MVNLTPDESRVLGVLIEKDRTTPDQYPLSLNAVVNGCNQKNNRDPVMTMPEQAAFEALESLRSKSLVVRIDGPGQRVNKYRHNTGEVVRLRAGEVAILAELLLRGPQTLGELRGRASRMHPMETLDVTKDFLRAMTEREEPLVKVLPPSPGSRAERYVQLLCPELHKIDPVPSDYSDDSSSPRATGAHGTLLQRVEALESEVSGLKQELVRLKVALGEAGPS